MGDPSFIIMIVLMLAMLYFFMIIIKVQIMEHSQPHGQHLPRCQQMAQICPGEGFACGTTTCGINGTGVQLVSLIFDVDSLWPLMSVWRILLHMNMLSRPVSVRPGG